ncbi:unnamed protein product [Paramecium octaurelia]|uniref:Uncharacterized protein n=1 Tax=Paramecium octaurelia TaxID=43137 RepID=A0A8S1SPF3_PAROT|nr:unnamed protein product [Paramecium octaurelia]
MLLRKRLTSLRKLAQFCTAESVSGKKAPTTQAQQTKVERNFQLQFSKSALVDFGELPTGEIPEALKYDRHSTLTQLDNGLRVVSELYNSPLASITVAVKAGSRFETLESSGVSNFISKLNLRGTTTKSREQVEAEIDYLGGSLKVKQGRELQTYTLTFLPSELERAVSFLGDILTNSLYSPAQIEAEREGIYRESVSINDQYRVVAEAAHYTNYRDHYLGQPTAGIRDNIPNVTEEQIRQFHKANFVAPNVVVSAAGNVNHEDLVSAVNKSFKGLGTSAPTEVPNSEKPHATPSIMLMKDDELTNLNVGVFFDAPGWNHPDVFALHYFQRLIGDYRADKHTGFHLNAPSRQYNTMHSLLGGLPDVTYQRCVYYAYSDTGLFGNYLIGNEVFATQMAYVSQMVLSDYASSVGQVEVFRARAKVFNELLSQESSAKQSREIAQQVFYWGRRVPRSEFARRISALDAGHLTRVATRHFWDKDISVVVWGPTHLLDAVAHYNRSWKRSTLGGYAQPYYEG